MENLINPLTGEVVNLPDASEEELAQTYMELDKVLGQVTNGLGILKKHFGERLEESKKDFGVQGFDVQFRPIKKYGVNERLEKKINNLKEKAKQLFNDNKTDIGVARVETRVTFKRD